MKFLSRIFPLLISVTVIFGLQSCNSPLDRVHSGGYENVFIYCGLGYNNLSTYLRANLDDLQEGTLPGLNDGRAIVAYCQNTDINTPRAYIDPDSAGFSSPPVLMQIYRYQGQARIDTLKVYDEERISTSPEAFRKALEDISSLFPSEHYGMLFSSHGTGWLPQGYTLKGENTDYANALNLQEAEEEKENSQQFPLTKTIGAFYRGSSSNSIEIDIRDFASSVPMKLDYLIFDACLMGNAEVVWELKDICDYLVVSPTEVLAQGMVYESLSWNLLSSKKADIETVCKEYFKRYDALSGYNRSASISLVDCTKIEKVADVFSEIVSYNNDSYKRYVQRDSIPSDPADRDSLSYYEYYLKVTRELNSRRKQIQGYFYDAKAYFYDIRDMAAHIGASESQLSELDAALENCIVYHAETPYFFNTPLENCCGLAVYLPHEDWEKLNAYYRRLSWNDTVGLVE